jgi:hypothetical protein
MNSKLSALRFLALVLVLLAALPLQASGQSLAGLWEIEGTPEGAPGPAFTNLSQTTTDGRVINLDPWFGTGLGQWQRVHGQTYVIEFTHYFLDGGAVGEVRVHGQVELSPDRQSFSGPFETQISIGGIVVDTLSGTVDAQRQ